MQYRYSMANTDSWGYCHDGEVTLSATPSFSKVLPDLECTTVESRSGITYPTEDRTQFEKLMSEEYYDATNKLIRKTRTPETPMKTAYQQEVIFNYDPYNVMISQVGWLANTLTCSYLKAFTKDTTYSEISNQYSITSCQKQT